MIKDAIDQPKSPNFRMSHHQCFIQRIYCTASTPKQHIRQQQRKARCRRDPPLLPTRASKAAAYSGPMIDPRGCDINARTFHSRWRFTHPRSMVASKCASPGALRRSVRLIYGLRRALPHTCVIHTAMPRTGDIPSPASQRGHFSTACRVRRRKSDYH